VSTTQTLPAGNYAFVCLIPVSDGIPHAAKGMVAPFTVTEPPAEAAAAPTSDGQIITNEYSFTVPPSFSGKGTFEIFNKGQQNHEMAVYKIADGKTLADVQAFLARPSLPRPAARHSFGRHLGGGARHEHARHARSHVRQLRDDVLLARHEDRRAPLHPRDDPTLHRLIGPGMLA
jgi:hypothetical protein